MATNTEPEFNVYTLLEQHGVQFAKHLRNILEKCGFTCLQSFVKEDADIDNGLKEITETVKSVFAAPQHLAKHFSVDSNTGISNMEYWSKANE